MKISTPSMLFVLILIYSNLFIETYYLALIVRVKLYQVTFSRLLLSVACNPLLYKSLFLLLLMFMALQP